MKKNIWPFILVTFFSFATLTSCTNYGKKVSHEYLEVYYKDGITREQAQQMLDVLYPLWKDDGSEKTRRKSIQLSKTGDTINFRMVTDESKLGQIDDEGLYRMTNAFSDSLFNGAPVNLDLTDDKFKTIKTLHYRRARTNDVAPAEPAQQ